MTTDPSRLGLPRHQAKKIGPSASPRRLRSLMETIRTSARLHGDGPAEASSNLCIEQQPFRWDTNGFYRALGLTPDATRVEIAHAYIERNGYTSEWITSAARTLIDKDTRRVYDALPLGSFWGDDSRLRDRLHEDDPDLVPHDAGVWWSVYLAEGVPDSAAATLDPEWWGILAIFLSRAGHSGGFAVGISPDGGVATVGWRDVIFVPFALAHHCDLDYAAQSAGSLVGLH